MNLSEGEVLRAVQILRLSGVKYITVWKVRRVLGIKCYTRAECARVSAFIARVLRRHFNTCDVYYTRRGKVYVT